MRRVFEVLRAIRPSVCEQNEADASMMTVLWDADLLASAECVCWNTRSYGGILIYWLLLLGGGER
jgi:hypothetical protein